MCETVDSSISETRKAREIVLQPFGIRIIAEVTT